MKIKIELYLPFQKLEQYNIQTDLDDIIQALPNSEIDKQEVLDSVLKYGLYDSEGQNFSLRKNKSAEIILTHPIYSPEEVTFLNNLNALKDDNFFNIKIHYYENVKSGEKYSEIVVDGEEHQNTLLFGGPYDTSNTIANEKEIANYKDALNANLIEKMKVKIADRHHIDEYDRHYKLLFYSQYLIRLKDFKFEEWLNKLLLSREEMVAKIKLDEELERMLLLLKSDTEISIKVSTEQEWYGTYIDSEGDEEQEGYFTTASTSVVSKDFLLNKLNEFVMGIQPLPFRRTRSIPLFLDNERDWLKEIEERELCLSKAYYYGYGRPDGFAEWMDVGPSFDENPKVFEGTDTIYSKPWDWDQDLIMGEGAESSLNITTGDNSSYFSDYFNIW